MMNERRQARAAPGFIAIGLLAASALLVALFLFPFDSDAAFANHDGLWYAMKAERGASEFIVSHHILFHVLLYAVVKPLKLLGVASPGGSGVRLIAGIGAAVVLILVAT